MLLIRLCSIIYPWLLCRGFCVVRLGLRGVGFVLPYGHPRDNVMPQQVTRHAAVQFLMMRVSATEVQAEAQSQKGAKVPA